MQAKHFNWSLGLWLAALFLTILGAKLWVIQLYGTNLPYWDEWDEARLFFRPWLEGQLPWSAWFAPHNEHRILFTRLLDAVELKLNGQWDPRLQMVINALMHAGYACGLAIGFWFFTGKKQAGRIGFLFAALFALPYAGENTVHSFQSQMYFLGIFSMAAMLGLGLGRAGGWAWGGGLLAAGLAIFTMGSGFLASAVVVGLVIVRSLKQRRCARPDRLTAAVALAVVGLGLAMNVSVDKHHQFQAKTAGIFLGAWGGNLAWPFADWPWLGPLTCLPLALLVFEYFRGQVKNTRAAELVLLLAGWSLLQDAALAYSRASLSGSSRYFDTLSILPLANLAALFTLADSGGLRQWPGALRRSMAVVWVGFLLIGFWQVSETTLAGYLQRGRAWALLEEENVRAFIRTDNPAQLNGKFEQAVPYPDPNGLVEILRKPSILAILPPDCRRPLPLANTPPADGGFARDGFAPEKPNQAFTETWGSFTTQGAAATGTFLSDPLESRFPRVLLPVCYGDQATGLQVRMVTADGRKTTLPIGPAGRWHELVFAPPPGGFRLEVTDASPTAWIAIGAVKEAGRFSVTAQSFTRLGGPILLAGLAGFMLLTGRKLFSREGDLPEGLILIVVAGVLVGVGQARKLDDSTYAAKLQKAWAVRAAQTSDWPAAQAHLRAALWFRPDDPEALCQLAEQTLAHSERPAAEAQQLAAAYCRAALKLRPEFPAAQACRQRLNF